MTLQLLLNDEEFRLWQMLPYFWFGFHWLAMSHSCYNPIIYCYMNSSYRGGFLRIFYNLPSFPSCRNWSRRVLTSNSTSHNNLTTGKMHTYINIYPTLIFLSAPRLTQIFIIFETICNKIHLRTQILTRRDINDKGKDIELLTH